MLARFFTQQARILIHNKFWMSIKIDNKLPTSEEEKQAMKQPYAVDKCPNKYASTHVGSSWRSARIIGTAGAGSPRNSPSAMDPTKAPPSRRKNLRLIRSQLGYASVGSRRTSPSATALTRNWNSENDDYSNQELSSAF